nr:hypothetical protein [Spirochaetaceae bacterium]
MLKKHERTFNFLQQLSDATAVSIAWLISYYIRFEVLEGGSSGLGLYFLELTPILILLTIFFYYKNQLYVSNRYYTWYKEILSVIYSNIQAIFTFVILFYFVAPNRVSRITIMLYLFISILTTITVRLIARNFIKTIRMKGRNLRYIILAGYSSSILEYVETVFHIKGAGLNIIGWIDSNGLSDKYKIPEINIEEISSSYQIIIDSREITIDAVIIGYPAKDSNRLNTALKISRKHL